MKTFTLQPTNENIINSFLNDLLGRNKYIFYFLNLLENIEGASTIALNGEWGSGKTFFVKQLKLVLDSKNTFYKNEFLNKKEICDCVPSTYKEKANNYITLYYDVWLHDNDEDPLLLFQCQWNDWANKDVPLKGHGIEILPYLFELVVL